MGTRAVRPCYANSTRWADRPRRASRAADRWDGLSGNSRLAGSFGSQRGVPVVYATVRLGAQAAHQSGKTRHGYCGLRASELWALRRKRLDLLRGRLHVAEAVTDVSGYLSFGPPKTGHSRRTVSLPRFLRDMLTEQVSGSSPGGTGPDDLVFTAPDGGTMAQRAFYGRFFRPAVKVAVAAGNLPPEKEGLRFHDLRHTCAALLIAQGAHAKAIKERLGHESIVITLDRYGHLLPSLDDELAEALDATLRERQRAREHGHTARPQWWQADAPSLTRFEQYGQYATVVGLIESPSQSTKNNGMAR